MGCQKKVTDETPVNVKSFFSYDSLLIAAKVLLHADNGIVLTGNFKGDTTRQAAAVIEVDKKNEKISFNLMEIKNNTLEKKDETKPLDGSLKECKIEKINLPGFPNDLIYYNSQIYFMGSSSGEVFSYIIDFKSQKTYYAHMVSEPRKPEFLYISDPGNQEIRKYFIDVFGKDYPSFKLTASDKVLN